MSTEALEEAAAVQAAAAHEAGRAEAAAEGAAADAQEAATAAQAAAADAKYTAEDLAAIVTAGLAPLVARIEALETGQVFIAQAAGDASADAAEALEAATEPVVVVEEEPPVEEVVEVQADNGLTVATEEDPTRAPPEVRKRRYRRI